MPTKEYQINELKDRIKTMQDFYNKIGQCIWDRKTTIDIISTILAIILGIASCIAVEASIIMLSHVFYKENNND